MTISKEKILQDKRNNASSINSNNNSFNNISSSNVKSVNRRTWDIRKF